MTSKVLIADDSLTIQKVIGITLANSGYELVECLNEDELFRKIQSNHFDLILLDFNLSDSRSGYELAKQINNVMPGAAIIVMLGTFDTIDESQFDACGISDKIVKPFESTKFIKKCRELLEGSRPTPVVTESKPIAQSPVEEEPTDNVDMWKVDAPVLNNDSDFELGLESEIQTNNLDPLTSEIAGWGFTPSTQLEDKFHKVFPPTIEEASDVNILDRLQSSSVFVQDEDLTEVDTDATDPNFKAPDDLNRDLLNEIEEDISADSFWAVDEIVPLKSEEEAYIIETNLDEVTADLTESVQAFRQKEAKAASQVVESEAGDTIIHMDQDELVEKLKISLRPMIEEMVKEFCKQHAEKVAWDVIPDLAENLIRKEIKEISKSV